MVPTLLDDAPVVPLRRPATDGRRVFRGLTRPTPPPLTFVLGVDRTADWHTHSLLGRGRATPLEMADAARDAGLRTWALTDHVTAEDTWIVEYAAMVRSFERDGVTIRCGVETTVLDQRGHLDMPGRLPFLDHALVTVVDLPGRTAPLEAADVRDRLRTGALDPAAVVDSVVTATVNAVRNCPARPVVGRLFSVLPLLGLDDSAVGDDHLYALAAACRATGGAVEVNERWRAPSARIAPWLAGAGVRLVAGSDATTPDAVGGGRYVERLTGTETTDLGDLVDLDTADELGASDGRPGAVPDLGALVHAS